MIEQVSISLSNRNIVNSVVLTLAHCSHPLRLLSDNSWEVANCLWPSLTLLPLVVARTQLTLRVHAPPFRLRHWLCLITTVDHSCCRSPILVLWSPRIDQPLLSPPPLVRSSLSSRWSWPAHRTLTSTRRSNALSTTYKVVNLDPISQIANQIETQTDSSEIHNQIEKQFDKIYLGSIWEL